MTRPPGRGWRGPRESRSVLLVKRRRLICPRAGPGLGLVDALPSPPRDGASKAAGMEELQLLADLGVPVVNISFNGEEDTKVVPSLIPPNKE